MQTNVLLLRTSCAVFIRLLRIELLSTASGAVDH